MESKEMGRLCVTGGTGFVGSWLIMRLLQHGYSVNTTIRSHPDRKREIKYLTKLEGASERLQIFNADMNKPQSFTAAIEGCVGVFHVAQPMDMEEEEEEVNEAKVKSVITATLAIVLIQRQLSESYILLVLLLLYLMIKGLDIVDESSWSDVNFIKFAKPLFPCYSTRITSLRDIKYMTNLEGASERLQIFNADINKPQSFSAAIEGCVGVFHLAQPMDFEKEEVDETKVKSVITATLAILQACVDSKTVKRVVYTSSAAAVILMIKA
ncbi:hypothetical protein H5410_012013 [Solanum commersonii]|uniref:3-beta hydroxysteroid dehydrogenase/isomerase domain-containing protein n=1 Tax=Solanum commersonii TaxID=4109 RepID=A0A9J6AR87_SOLCO|nr:hypothetical protein H5410_012013 [Solanum commersonii]